MRPIGSSARWTSPNDFRPLRREKASPMGFSLLSPILSSALSFSSERRKRETEETTGARDGAGATGSFPAGRRGKSEPRRERSGAERGERGRQRALNRKYSLMDGKRCARNDIVDALCIELSEHFLASRCIPIRPRQTCRVVLSGR
jgi:hypothetical protein